MSSLKTRFPGLSYKKEAPGQWTFIDDSTSGAVGPKYPTQIEILSDAQRFAEERGYTPSSGHTVTLWHTPANIIHGDKWKLHIANSEFDVFVPLNEMQVKLLQTAKVKEHHEGEPAPEQGHKLADVILPRTDEEYIKARDKNKFKQAEETAYNYLKRKQDIQQLMTKGINWELLKEQKLHLLKIADENTDLRTGQDAAIDGIIGFIDAMQDCAVDNFGVPEEKVYLKEKD